MFQVLMVVPHLSLISGLVKVPYFLLSPHWSLLIGSTVIDDPGLERSDSLSLLRHISMVLTISIMNFETLISYPSESQLVGQSGLRNQAKRIHKKTKILIKEDV